MLRIITIITFISAALQLSAQEDSLFNLNQTLNEIVVTATRTERRLGNVAVPVTIINKQSIQRSGSVRLRDILQEQAGLYITNSFGAGVQMQGLNPDYTLILVNGEPLIGRTGGVLDLNRVAVGNIKRIEIVKGPSSSLYGSEALAGVINIITDNNYQTKLGAGLRYSFGNPDIGWAFPVGKNTFKSTDLNLQGSTSLSKLGVQFFSNANYLDGISFRPFSKDKMAQPIWRITNQVQFSYPFSIHTDLSLSVRHAYDHIKQEFAVSNNGIITNSYGREANSDLSFNPVLSHQFGKKVKSSLRLYATWYNGSQQLKFKEVPDSSYTDEFRQQYYKAENQTDISWKKITLTGGAGIIADGVRSTRYDEFSSRKSNTIMYGFVQQEWWPHDKTTLIAGIRYDDNKLFAGAFSPKLAVRYKASDKIILNASIGRGFKAPDFRQLYLNFTNNAAGGYSVYGTIDAVKVITELQRMGQVSEITEDFYRLDKLKPEFSTGINIGSRFFFSKNLSFSLNIFRNDIEQLIDVRQVATKSSGAQIFSYINVNKAFTEGAEIELNWQPAKHLKIFSGYQLLITADKEELKNVKNGKEYTRDENGGSRIMNKNEYIGLPGRSKHMANLKISYDTPKNFFATARVMYRSRWAVSDRDGNGLYNTNDEFAKGFPLVNISAGKTFNKYITIQAGMDNLFNYQDMDNLPTFQGRMIYASFKMELLNCK